MEKVPSQNIVFSIVLDRRRPKSPKSRNREGWVLELGIAPPSCKPAGKTRRQTTLINALSDQDQAVSPPSPNRGRASRAQGEDPPSSPRFRQPRGGGRTGGPAPERPPRAGGLACPSQRLARPYPFPARSSGPGWSAPHQASTIPGVLKMSGIVAVFRLYFGPKFWKGTVGGLYSLFQVP